MRALALFALLTATACAGASHELISPGLYSVECKRKAANCYREAASVCPSGFDVLDGASRQGAIANTAGQSTVVVPTFDGELLVRCR